MNASPKPFAATLVILGITLGGLQGEPVSGAGKASHFWDPIPVSPSTTVPGKIIDGYWRGQFERVNREVAQADQAEVVFFGDSITWHWSLGQRTGREVWEKEYSRFHPINMGNSGDITPVMLYRATHGNLEFPENRQPKVAVLLCGTNNFVVMQSAAGKVQWDLGPECPPEEVAAGVRAIAQVFRRRLPETRVLLLGILPVANEKKWPKCRKVNALHAALACDGDEVVFVDLEEHFLQPDGGIRKPLFTDGTHLTPEGYQIWAESIDPLISKMLEAPPLDPVRIMLIGDSITEGKDSATCYRRYLDGMLRREGRLIDFVGSRRKHHDNRSEADSYEFDVQHEGHWGRDSAWLAENLPGMLEAEAPDVAVLHIGTEDLVSKTTAIEPLTDEILINIGTVTASLRARNENVKIVLSQVIPVRGKTREVGVLNAKIAQFAAANPTSRSPIVAADLQAGFEVAEDLGDSGVLPSPSGAKKMARILAGKVHGLLEGAKP